MYTYRAKGAYIRSRQKCLEDFFILEKSHLSTSLIETLNIEGTVTNNPQAIAHFCAKFLWWIMRGCKMQVNKFNYNDGQSTDTGRGQTLRWWWWSRDEMAIRWWCGEEREEKPRNRWTSRRHEELTKSKRHEELTKSNGERGLTRHKNRTHTREQPQRSDNMRGNLLTYKGRWNQRQLVTLINTTSNHTHSITLTQTPQC